MKDMIMLSIFLLCLSACGTSPDDLAFRTQEAWTATAANWTEIPTLTPTATFTSTPTLTPTSTFTPTPTDTPTPTPTPFAGGGQVSFWTSDKKLYVVNMDGSNPELIFDAEKEGFLNAGGVTFWSPSEKYLTFSVNGSGYGNFLIYIYDSTSKDTRLFNEGFWNDLCTWDMDESGLVCGWGNGIYKIPLTSPSEPELISSDYPCSEGIPRSVREDNQYLLLVTGYRSAEGLTQLVLVDDECSIVQSIYSEKFNTIGIGWSISQFIDQKFTYLLIDSTKNKNKSTLIEYDFSSQTSVQIFELDEYTMGYKISPDGNWIAMVNSSVITDALSIQMGGNVFRVMNIESQEIIFELDEAYQMGEFCWSPDSQYLFFNTQRLHIASGEIADFLGITGVPTTSMSNLSCSP